MGQLVQMGYDTAVSFPPKSLYEECGVEELQELLWSLINSKVMGPIINTYARRGKLQFFFPISRYFFLFHAPDTGFIVKCNITGVTSFTMEIIIYDWQLNFTIKCDGSDPNNIHWSLDLSSQQGMYDTKADRKVLTSLIGLCADAVLEEYYS